jgi:hypothetical protein
MIFNNLPNPFDSNRPFGYPTFSRNENQEQKNNILLSKAAGGA